MLLALIGQSKRVGKHTLFWYFIEIICVFDEQLLPEISHLFRCLEIVTQTENLSQM